MNPENYNTILMANTAKQTSIWFFLAYLIGSLTLFAATTGYASYAASNYHDAYYGGYYGAFIAMALVAGLCALYTIIAFFAFFAHKSVNSPIIRSFHVVTLFGHVSIWIIALVIMCFLWAIAYCIIVMIWTTLTFIIGVIALVRNTKGATIDDYQDINGETHPVSAPAEDAVMMQPEY